MKLLEYKTTLAPLSTMLELHHLINWLVLLTECLVAKVSHIKDTGTLLHWETNLILPCFTKTGPMKDK